MIVESLPLSALILATETLDLDAEPDEGRLAQLAKAADQAKESAAWVHELDIEAGRLLVAAEELRMRLDGDASLEDRAAIEAELADAEGVATAAYRKYVDAKVRHFSRQERLAQLDPHHVDGELDPSIWRSSSRKANDARRT
jgi:hypothetical protein